MGTDLTHDWPTSPLIGSATSIVPIGRSLEGRTEIRLAVSNFPDLTSLWSIINRVGRNPTESFSTVKAAARLLSGAGQLV